MWCANAVSCEPFYFAIACHSTKRQPAEADINHAHSEHFSTSRHALGFNRGIANSCQYVVPKEKLGGLSAQTVVENAVARSILRLGGLRVGIAGEDTNKACFVRVPSMDLQDFIEWNTVTASDPTQYDEKVLQTIKSRLEQLWLDVPSRPPWKLLVVQGTSSTPGDVVVDMIFATHHALADGKSTTVFHTQLLQELNTATGPPPELKNHVLTFTDSPILAPSQEDLVPLTISWIFFLKTLWTALAPSWLKPAPPPAPWTGKPVDPEPHNLHLRLVTIAPDTMPRLVAACRAHGTTFSGILHVLVLASLARRVPAGVASSFASQTPISLLPWARIPPGAPAMDLNAVLTDLNTGVKRVWGVDTVSELRAKLSAHPGDDAAEVEEEVAWPLARVWRDDIKAKVATLPRDDVVGLLGYLGDLRAHWLGKLGKPRDATWEISNIGSMKGEGLGGAGGAWSIRRSLFSQPVPVASVAFSVNVAGLEDGPVSLVLSWQETIVDDSLVDGVAGDLRAWLGEFGRSGKFGITNGT